MKLVQEPQLGLLLSVPEGTKSLLVENFQSELPLTIECSTDTQVEITGCLFGGHWTPLGELVRRMPYWCQRLCFSRPLAIIRRCFVKEVSLPEGATAWIEIRNPGVELPVIEEG